MVKTKDLLDFYNTRTASGLEVNTRLKSEHSILDIHECTLVKPLIPADVLLLEGFKKIMRIVLKQGFESEEVIRSFASHLPEKLKILEIEKCPSNAPEILLKNHQIERLSVSGSKPWTKLESPTLQSLSLNLPPGATHYDLSQLTRLEYLSLRLDEQGTTVSFPPCIESTILLESQSDKFQYEIGPKNLINFPTTKLVKLYNVKISSSGFVSHCQHVEISGSSVDLTDLQNQFPNLSKLALHLKGKLPTLESLSVNVHLKEVEVTGDERLKEAITQYQKALPLVAFSANLTTKNPFEYWRFSDKKWTSGIDR